ncbi:MAG TPA: MerR family transcriptional regulator [Oscillatoriaceae cyanobacterium]
MFQTASLAVAADEQPVITMAEHDAREWSTSEVAKELGISPSLVRTWIAYMNWEVCRNAEGHRVFNDEDVEQLKGLKSWLDEGHTLKEYRRERQIEGEYDPRLELRGAHRRLKELAQQQEALLAKQQDLVEKTRAQREALFAQLTRIQHGLEPESGEAAPEPAPAVDTSQLIQAVLKQLLTAVMAKQGKLQLVRRFEEDGKTRLEYQAPTGKRQIVEDVCTSEADRKLLETVLTLILSS